MNVSPTKRTPLAGTWIRRASVVSAPRTRWRVLPEEVAKRNAGRVDDLELVGEPRVGDHLRIRPGHRGQAADVVPVRMGHEDVGDRLRADLAERADRRSRIG